MSIRELNFGDLAASGSSGASPSGGFDFLEATEARLGTRSKLEELIGLEDLNQLSNICLAITYHVHIIIVVISKELAQISS